MAAETSVVCWIMPTGSKVLECDFRPRVEGGGACQLQGVWISYRLALGGARYRWRGRCQQWGQQAGWVSGNSTKEPSGWKFGGRGSWGWQAAVAGQVVRLCEEEEGQVRRLQVRQGLGQSKRAREWPSCGDSTTHHKTHSHSVQSIGGSCSKPKFGKSRI